MGDCPGCSAAAIQEAKRAGETFTCPVCGIKVNASGSVKSVDGP